MTGSSDLPHGAATPAGAEPRGITAPLGFTAAAVAAGIKSQGLDLALIVADWGCATAAVFTSNRAGGAAAARAILTTDAAVDPRLLHSALCGDLIPGAHLGGEDVLAAAQRQFPAVVLGVHAGIAHEDAAVELPAAQVGLDLLDRGDGQARTSTAKVLDRELGRPRAVSASGPFSLDADALDLVEADLVLSPTAPGGGMAP